MSEHSIEELERQLRSLEGQMAEAALRVNEAKRRLNEAKFAATGFAGCIAEYETDSWRSRGKIVRFLPKSMSRRGGYIEGPIIKVDGTVGTRIVSCRPDKARNLGPYKPDETSHA